ncbi:hypothetical protein ABK040_014757 [Willaertia magna]
MSAINDVTTSSSLPTPIVTNNNNSDIFTNYQIGLSSYKGNSPLQQYQNYRSSNNHRHLPPVYSANHTSSSPINTSSSKKKYINAPNSNNSNNNQSLLHPNQGSKNHLSPIVSGNSHTTSSSVWSYSTNTSISGPPFCEINPSPIFSSSPFPKASLNTNNIKIEDVRTSLLSTAVFTATRKFLGLPLMMIRGNLQCPPEFSEQNNVFLKSKALCTSPRESDAESTATSITVFNGNTPTPNNSGSKGAFIRRRRSSFDSGVMTCVSSADDTQNDVLTFQTRFSLGSLGSPQDINDIQMGLNSPSSLSPINSPTNLGGSFKFSSFIVSSPPRGLEESQLQTQLQNQLTLNDNNDNQKEDDPTLRHLREAIRKQEEMEQNDFVRIRRMLREQERQEEEQEFSTTSLSTSEHSEYTVKEEEEDDEQLEEHGIKRKRKPRSEYVLDKKQKEGNQDLQRMSLTSSKVNILSSNSIHNINNNTSKNNTIDNNSPKNKFFGFLGKVFGKKKKEEIQPNQTTPHLYSTDIQQRSLWDSLNNNTRSLSTGNINHFQNFRLSDENNQSLLLPPASSLIQTVDQPNKDQHSIFETNGVYQYLNNGNTYSSPMYYGNHTPLHLPVQTPPTYHEVNEHQFPISPPNSPPKTQSVLSVLASTSTAPLQQKSPVIENSTQKVGNSTNNNNTKTQNNNVSQMTDDNSNDDDSEYQLEEEDMEDEDSVPTKKSSSKSSPSVAPNSNGEFVCETCGKIFAQYANLKRHQRLHSGNKPYECTWEGCTKKFARRSDLQTHLRIHTRERPYVCSFEGCGKDFTTCSNLRRHERSVHGKKKK